VRGAATAGAAPSGSGGERSTATPRRHPSNERADDAGSVDEPEVLARARAAKRRLDLAHDGGQSERRQARAHLQRDVARVLGEERLSPSVEHDRARPGRSAAAVAIEALPAEVEHADCLITVYVRALVVECQDMRCAPRQQPRARPSGERSRYRTPPTTGNGPRTPAIKSHPAPIRSDPLRLRPSAATASRPSLPTPRRAARRGGSRGGRARRGGRRGGSGSGSRAGRRARSARG
jgi:hypothetical protein